MKTGLFLTIALAALAAGVTTAIVISPVQVHAGELILHPGQCHGDVGVVGCTGPFPGQICNHGICTGTGRGTDQ